jgi:hypothetical protein
VDKGVGEFEVSIVNLSVDVEIYIKWSIKYFVKIIYGWEYNAWGIE